MSFLLDDLGQRLGAVARQEATVMKVCEGIVQKMADIRRVTAPLEQVTTLQRVVRSLEPKSRIPGRSVPEVKNQASRRDRTGRQHSRLVG